MTDAQTEARAIARYEVFADPSYYDLWAVRPVGEQSFNATIHAASHADAEAIATALAAKDAELAEVHQQYVDANEARIDAEALSRTGAAKVDRQRLNIEIRKWATDSDLYITIDDVEALHLAILSALEPAAQEGWQEAVRIGDAVLDWMVKFDLLDAGNEYYVSDVLAVLNDLTPSTRPSEQAVTDEMVTRALSAYDKDHPHSKAAMRAALSAALARKEGKP